jgi:hypothetical protein
MVYRLRSGRRVTWRPIPEDEKGWTTGDELVLHACGVGLVALLGFLGYCAVWAARSLS